MPARFLWRAMKGLQRSSGILMTDFLEAALREMASSVLAALLCQSSSTHPSRLPAPGAPAVTVTLGKRQQMELSLALQVSSTYSSKHPQPSTLPFAVQAAQRAHTARQVTIGEKGGESNRSWLQAHLHSCREG